MKKAADLAAAFFFKLMYQVNSELAKRKLVLARIFLVVQPNRIP